MLVAVAADGVPLEVGLRDGSPAGFALPVGAFAQSLQRAIDRVEDGCRLDQIRLRVLLHEGQGSARMG